MGPAEADVKIREMSPRDGLQHSVAPTRSASNELSPSSRGCG